MIFLPNDDFFKGMHKINSYNQLFNNDCPVLKSVLLDENETLDKKSIEHIKNYLKCDYCTIRYQYIRPNNKPVIGGNKIKICESEINKMRVEGTRIWLLEEVERSQNLYGFSIYLKKNIGTIIEIVGKGFDGSDLNRGDLTPHEIIFCDNPIRMGYDLEWWKFIKIKICSQKEFDNSKRIRLKKLEKLNYSNISGCIFDIQYKPMPYYILENIIRYIKILEKLEYDSCVIAGSVIDYGRIIFWDIQTAKDKIEIYSIKGEKMNRKLEGCIFCEKDRFYYHKLIGLRYDDAIIYEDENLYITPDISPVTLGHYLIITKKHIHGYANASEGTFESLKLAIKFLKEKVLKTEELTVFEHGAIKEGKAGASIDHAHLHVIPGFYNLCEIVDKTNVYEQKIDFSKENLIGLADKHPYLWVSDQEKSFLYVVDELPSQFLREVFMQCRSSDYTYNWRDEYTNKKSIEMYKKTLDLYKNSLGNKTN